ncbi:MAG TPA: tyrosine-type recombinase/integrase, partial [Gaiellaceae bacterium]|nr:tyrosine-type recombinase/integrase [Gaiellaceae bacterium]
AGVVHIRRVYTAGPDVKLVGKNSRSLRAVPLPARALEAFDSTLARLDTRLLFPAALGGHLNLNTWRSREWRPALKAAGIDSRGPYALRHTYATWSIAAGVSLYELARFMGTSVEQIDKTYGHLMPDAIERTRTRLDAFMERSFPERSQTAEASE